MNVQPNTPGARLHALFKKHSVAFDTVKHHDGLKAAGVTVERFQALMEGGAQFNKRDGRALARFFGMLESDFTSLLSGADEQPLFVDDHGFSSYASVGDSIAATRKSKNISQMQLSAKCGIAQAQLSALERSKGRPRLTTMHKIASALGVEWKALIPKMLASHYIAEAAKLATFRDDAALLAELADVL